MGWQAHLPEPPRRGRARALGYGAVRELQLWHCGSIIDCSAACQSKWPATSLRGSRQDAPCFPLPLFTAVAATFHRDHPITQAALSPELPGITLA